MRPLLASLFLLAPLAAQTTTVTISASEDATLYQDAAGQLANDAGVHVFIGKNASNEIRRTVIKFPVAATIPADAVVTDCRLEFVVLRSILIDPTPTSLHRVTSSWTEGSTNAGSPGGGGASATTGDTTWVWREYATQAWAQPGGDFDPIPSAQAAIGFTGVFAIGGSLRMNADVEAWADGAPNHGWLLRTDEVTVQDARRLGSRTNSSVANRPRLVVTYLPAGGRLDRGAGCAGSTGLPLRQTVVGTPQRGGACTLAVTQGPPQQFTLTLLGSRLAPTPVPLVPGCNFELDALTDFNLGISLLDGAGAKNYAFTIPNDAFLLGLPVSFQSLALDPLAPPSQLVVANGSMIVIG